MLVIYEETGCCNALNVHCFHTLVACCCLYDCMTMQSAVFIFKPSMGVSSCKDAATTIINLNEHLRWYRIRCRKCSAWSLRRKQRPHQRHNPIGTLSGNFKPLNVMRASPWQLKHCDKPVGDWRCARIPGQVHFPSTVFRRTRHLHA